MASSPYRPLSRGSSEVRLLILTPGSWEDGIQCSLFYVPLDDAPKYEALSYTLGSAEDTWPITLQSKPWTVATELAIALRHLRREHEPRTLWFDALCINQGDLQERAEQVPRMFKMYASATQVVAWTGGADDGSDSAISDIMALGTFMTKKHEEVPDGTFSTAFTADFFTGSGLDIQAMNWNGIYQFCCRPYWNRIWVLQDLATCGNCCRAAQDRCLIGCGPRWFPKRFLDWTIVFMNRAIDQIAVLGNGGSNITEPYRTLLENKAFPAACVIFDTILKICKAGGRLPVDYVLQCTDLLQATDPRDRVYALLGVLPELEGKIVPDYTITAEHVLIDVVKYCIEYKKNLNCLAINLPTETSPSWIPTFNRLGAQSMLWFAKKYTFRASGSSTVQAAISTVDRTLKIRGVGVGTVGVSIGPFSELSKDATKRSMSELHSVAMANDRRHWRRVDELYREIAANEVRREAFWRVFVLDRNTITKDLRPMPAPAEYGQFVRVFYELENVPEDFRPDMVREERREAYLARFFAVQVRQVRQNRVPARRCFIITEAMESRGDDEKLGWGPCNTKVGDEVVIFGGGSMCFVVRLVEDGRYVFVGDAYIQGVMDGSFYDECAQRGEEREYTLC